MRKQTEFSPVIFLDTNALHLTRLYLEAAENHGLPPFGNKGIDVGLGDRMGERTKENIKKGYKTIAYLQTKSIDGARVFFAPIAALEVVCGQLRSKAILSAAGEGIPSRWWNRFGEEEILARLEKGHYESVEDLIDNVRQRFERTGITILDMDNRRMAEVWGIARTVLSGIYLDVCDCLIFSSALVDEADEIISFDDYFRFIVNKVKNPEGDQVYERANQLIKKALAACIGTTEKKIRLPLAPKSVGANLRIKQVTPEAKS